MTDDNARYRSSDPFARSPDAGGHVSDPLAELARLIGQGDQFADIGRAPSRDEPPPREPQYYDDPPPEQQGEYRDSYPDDQARFDARYPDEPAPSYPPEPAAHYPQEPEPRYAPEPDARYASEPAPYQPPEPEPGYAPDPLPSYSPEPPRFAATDRFASADRHFDEPASPPPPPWHRTPQDSKFDPFAPPSSLSGSDEAPPAPTPRVVQPDFLLAALKSMPAAQGHQPSAQPEPADQHEAPMYAMSDRGQPPPAPPLDEYYDDVPQGRRAGGMMTVAAVFMLAVVGTGAAFAYRTWVNPLSVATKGEPKVIRASAEPVKVAPPPAADPNANKISYDRFADRGKNEKVVPREERPVDLQQAAALAAPAAAPAPVPPASPAPVPPRANGAAAPASSASSNPPSVLTDPKRVRTVTIRPDAPDTTSAASRTAIANAPTPAPAPQRQPSAQASANASANAPLDLSNPQQARASAPRPSAPPPAARPAPAPSSANAPLSLSPDAPLPPPGTRPQRVASAPAATASAPTGNGRYHVQVSSQRSEADAQAAFRSLRSKYSSVLGDRQPVIRRAELAGKGTYYRAMVGPFATREQAVQLCSSLKAAGGDCVVQAN